LHELIEWAWAMEVGKTWLVGRKGAFDSAFWVIEKSIKWNSMGGTVSWLFGRKFWILKTIPYTALETMVSFRWILDRNSHWRLTLLTKVLVQSINIWNRWKRVELSSDTVLVWGKVQHMGYRTRKEKVRANIIEKILTFRCFKQFITIFSIYDVIIFTQAINCKREGWYRLYLKKNVTNLTVLTIL